VVFTLLVLNAVPLVLVGTGVFNMAATERPGALETTLAHIAGEGPEEAGHAHTHEHAAEERLSEADRETTKER
jgi:hypothetical protein